MKNIIFMRWINTHFPNPKDFSQQLGIPEEEILGFFNNLKPKLKKIPKVKSEDKLKKIDIVFNEEEEFINLSD